MSSLVFPTPAGLEELLADGEALKARVRAFGARSGRPEAAMLEGVLDLMISTWRAGADLMSPEAVASARQQVAGMLDAFELAEATIASAKMHRPRCERA